MAITSTDLLKETTVPDLAPVLAHVAAAAATGFMKGLGVAGPEFETTARSMKWLLEQARTVRKTTTELAAKSGIKSVEPREVMAQSMGRDQKGRYIVGNQYNITKPNLALEVGQMIMYVYDPKTKKKLPYYDTFPLVFPINLKEDGFLGINMHYLPPTSRAILMDALYSLLNNLNMDHTTRLQVSYEILKNATKFREFKPCLKRYLSSHVRSMRLTVHPTQWDMVMMLPTARFIKANQLRVWNDSLDIINGIKRNTKAPNFPV